MTGTALIGPLRRWHFGAYPADVVLTADLPRNTLDIRYTACAQHRFACDCREAEIAECAAELRGEVRSWTRAARTVLAGHRAWDWGEDADGNPADWRGNGPLACQCHGCQIVRAAHASVYTFGSDYDTGRIVALDAQGAEIDR